MRWFFRIFQSRTQPFRGWVSPSGRRFLTSGDHRVHAAKLLRKYYRRWKWEKEFIAGGIPYPVAALEDKNWVRVACTGAYSAARRNKKTLSTLIELVSELPPDHEVVVDFGQDWWRGTARKFLDEI